MLTMREVFEKIEKYDSIVIFGHKLPDGDCYGSQIGLKEILNLNFPDKKVYVVGSGFPSLFPVLGGMDEVSDEIIKESLCILIDMNYFTRSEDTRLEMGKDFLKIDHHIDENGFEYDCYVDNDSIAACQIVAEMAKTLNLKMSSKAANALFLGICTDSGRFQFQPCGSKTFSIVSWLFEFGVDSKTLFDIIYEIDPKKLKYKGYMMLNYEVSPHGVAFFRARNTLYPQYGLEFKEISNQVNTLANIKGCPIWLLFTEDLNGDVRIEFRSNGIDVQQAAAYFGGGGHLCASGARLLGEGSYDRIMEVVTYCDELIAKENK